MKSGSDTILTAILPYEAGAQRRPWQVGLVVLAGAAFIALSARIQVPMWPVPMTMQTLAVLMVAMAFGARIGLATVTLYLLQGAVGLPVFAAGGGLAYFAGPTAGYLWAFLVVAAVVGWLAERGFTRSVAGAFVTAIIGSAIIYVIGAGWLAIMVSADTAIASGVLPFILGDLVKSALAAILLPTAWTFLSGTR